MHYAAKNNKGMYATLNLVSCFFLTKSLKLTTAYTDNYYFHLLKLSNVKVTFSRKSSTIMPINNI